MRHSILLAVVLAALTATLCMGQTDSTRKDSVHFVSESQIQFPDITERMFLLATMIVCMGGLALILNAKRRAADMRTD